MSFNPDIAKQAKEIIFLGKKMIQVIQVYMLIMHEYNDNLLKRSWSLFR